MDSRVVFLPALLMVASACAQTPAQNIAPNGQAHAANAQVTYAALRADLPGAESVMVKDFSLTREGGVFHFDQGDFYFYSPVEGKVTGAVFVGEFAVGVDQQGTPVGCGFQLVGAQFGGLLGQEAFGVFGGVGWRGVGQVAEEGLDHAQVLPVE